MQLQNVLPADIEKRSMEIIGEELGQIKIDPEKLDIVKRVIHTSADFDYARNLLGSVMGIGVELGSGAARTGQDRYAAIA